MMISDWQILDVYTI